MPGSALTSGLSAGSWLHDRPVQLARTPGVVNAAAEGAVVGTDGSLEGEGEENEDDAIVVDGELEREGDDAIVVDDGEGDDAVQPAMRPSATRAAPTRLMRPSRDLLQQDTIGYIELPPSSELQAHASSIGTNEAVGEGEGVGMGSSVLVGTTVGDADVTLGFAAGALAWGLVAHPIATTQTKPNKTVPAFISTPARLSPSLTSETVQM